MNFSSASHEWLVVARARAQSKGAGTIDGESGYSFMLTAIDSGQPGGGDADMFRIKIRETATQIVVFDNVLGGTDDGPAQALASGSIIIHTKK